MKKSIAEQHSEFLQLAYCGLVLRGFDRERDIPDAILRKVWRLGKRVHLSTRRFKTQSDRGKRAWMI